MSDPRNALVLAAIMLSGCAPPEIHRDDTRINVRVPSPDRSLEAIYAEDVGGGAAVGATEEVFVVEKGRFPKLKERLFSEECVRNIALRWTTPRELEINYEVASDFREHPHPYGSSPLTIFSSGYWTFSHPDGVSVRLVRHLTPPAGGC